jgi:hypothetical protein
MTKVHDLGAEYRTFSKRDVKYGSHGHNGKNWPHRPWSERFPELTVKKVLADSVPFGTSISHNSKVWAAFDGDRFVCAGATADECRRKYCAIKLRESAAAAEARRNEESQF